MAAANAASPDTTASTRGSICPRSARTNTWPSCAATPGRSTVGQVVQAVLGGHPAGRAVAGRPPPAQPVVGADVRVEPPVAVGRGDPLVAAPVEQGVDQRVHRAVGLEHPLAGVRHVDAHGVEQLEHLGRVAQVGRLPAGHVAQHQRVAGAPGGELLGVRVVGRGPDGVGEQLLGARPVDGQPVAAQLEAQHRGRRLREHRADQAHRGRRGRVVLQVGRLERRPRPGAPGVGVAQPLVVVAAQVPGGVDERVGRRWAGRRPRTRTGRRWGERARSSTGMPCAAAQHWPAVALHPPCRSRWASATSQARATGTPASTRAAAAASADHHTQRGERSASSRRAASTTSRQRAGVGIGRRGAARPTARRGPEA